jgi:putative transposase
MTRKLKLNLEQISNYQDQNNQQNNFQENLNQDSFKEQIIAGLKSGKGLTGKGGIFSGMVKEALETILAEELNQHLTGERQNLGNGFDNRRNGHNSKTIKTKESAFVLNTPRDRNSSFEPQIIKKNQTVLTEELDNKIIALYGFGMGYRDIVEHIEDIYGIEISKSSITAITDKILPKIKEWQNRPLDEIYPIIFLDAMHFKCNEEGKVVRLC